MLMWSKEESLKKTCQKRKKIPPSLAEQVFMIARILLLELIYNALATGALLLPNYQGDGCVWNEIKIDLKL